MIWRMVCDSCLLRDFTKTRKGIRPSARLLRRSKHRPDPLLDALGVDIHPVVCPVDAFRIPSDSLEVFVREHCGSFPDVSSFKDEAVVKHERQKLVEGDFLRADLTPRITKALEVRIHFLCA